MPEYICSYPPCNVSFIGRPPRNRDKTPYCSPEHRLAHIHEHLGLPEGMKRCRKCGEIKSIENDFHANAYAYDGVQSQCKACIGDRDTAKRAARGFKDLPSYVARDPVTGRTMSIATLEERFWALVDRSGGPDACWPWLGATDKTRIGYGLFTIRRKEDVPQGLTTRQAGHTYLAHRVAYVLTIGPIPDGQEVLHKCDNPPCCNSEAHHFTGTTLDNIADRVMKGRSCHGEDHDSAKLTKIQAIAIYALKGLMSSHIAAAHFPISASTVRKIWAKTIWKEIHK